MLAKKYPELENPIRSARKMSWLDKWRDIQFHRGLAKTDERMLHEQIKDDARAEGHAEVIELLNQGLSIGEIKQRLTQKTNK